MLIANECLKLQYHISSSPSLTLFSTTPEEHERIKMEIYQEKLTKSQNLP